LQKFITAKANIKKYRVSMQLEKFKEQVKSSVKESMSPHNQMQNINAYD